MCFHCLAYVMSIYITCYKYPPLIHLTSVTLLCMQNLHKSHAHRSLLLAFHFASSLIPSLTSHTAFLIYLFGCFYHFFVNYTLLMHIVAHWYLFSILDIHMMLNPHQLMRAILYSKL